MYAGTSFGARNESSMDNAPIHDEARYDPVTRTLTTLDVGLNSLLALDAEMLAEIAGELGIEDAAAEFAKLAERTRRAIATHLWDDARGIFANRLRGGGFVRSVGPTSFYPLIAGAVDATRLPRLLAQLDDPQGFAGAFALPSVRRDDPAYRDNTYWRGRVWPPLNWLVWHGLRRVGEAERARALAQASVRMFQRVWTERRLCPENYNAETGEPLDQPDTEGFYGWGALMPAMGVGELCDVTPWAGWTIRHDGGAWRLGPLLTPAGRIVLTASDGWLELRRGQTALLRTSLRGRLSRLRLDAAGLALALPPQSQEARLVLPATPPDRIALATLERAPVTVEAEGAGSALTIPPAPASRVLAVHCTG
jgi:putative isomerase